MVQGVEVAGEPGVPGGVEAGYHREELSSAATKPVVLLASDRIGRRARRPGQHEPPHRGAVSELLRRVVCYQRVAAPWREAADPACQDKLFEASWRDGTPCK